MRNLRHPDPGRDGINKDTVVFQDIIDCLVRRDGDGGANALLGRFEETGHSRNGLLFNRSLDRVKDMCDMMKAAVNDIRRDINKGEI